MSNNILQLVVGMNPAEMSGSSFWFHVVSLITAQRFGPGYNLRFFKAMQFAKEIRQRPEHQIHSSWADAFKQRHIKFIISQLGVPAATLLSLHLLQSTIRSLA